MKVNLATDRHPGTITKRSQIAFAITSIVITLERLGMQLLGLAAQFLTGVSVPSLGFCIFQWNSVYEVLHRSRFL